MSSRILTEKELKELLDEESFQNIVDPKEAFIDSINPFRYIELDSNALAFDRIHKVLNRNLKMTLIFGSPGTGKSMFLSRLNSDLLASGKSSILISSPILDDEQLFQTISFEIFRNSNLQSFPKNFQELIDILSDPNEYLERLRPILLLDESQLYTNSTLEKVRLLADTEKIRVIFAVHKLKEDDLFVKEHFKSRIWEKIELTNASLNELKVYIQKKLMGISMLSLANGFTRRVVKAIHKITAGNYRVTNNLLYSYFNNYPELYRSQFQKEKLSIRIKELEITAIQIGFLKYSGTQNLDYRHLPTAEAIWRKEQRKYILKIFSILSIPALSYLAYTHFSDFDLNSTSKNETNLTEMVSSTSSVVAKNENLEEKNPTFEVPKFNEIIEKKEEIVSENYNYENELKEIEDDLEIAKEKEFQNNKFEEDDEFIPDTVTEEENRVANLFKEVVPENENFEAEKIEKVAENRFVDEVFEEPVSEKSEEKTINKYIEDLSINKVIFKNPIKFSPEIPIKVDFTENHLFENKKEVQLKKEFWKENSLESGIKLLSLYLEEKNYEELYNLSIKINSENQYLKEPYIFIYKALIEEKAFEDAKIVRDSCKSCKFGDWF
jgi:type II secretory pathway predicted ATPase ExeA